MRLSRTSRRLFTEQRHVVSHRIPTEKKRLDTALLVLAIVSVFVFLVELSSPDPLGLLFGFSLLVDFVFLADYLLRVYYSGLDSAGRWSFTRAAENYLFRWYGIVDALATLPPILTHLFHVFALFTEFTRISRLLRLARFTRFLRVFRAARVFKETRKVTRLMRAHHSNISRELNFTLGIVIVVIVAGGLGLHYLSGPSDAHYRNPLEAIYWSIMSVMGQANPDELISWSTRVLGIVIIFAGIAFFGIVSGSITTFIMDAMNKRSNGTEEFIGRDHIVVCGFNSKLEELLGYLRRLPEGREIVLLFESESEHAAQGFVGSFEDEESGKAVHTQWVRGNPRTAEGMKRANVAEAHEIIVLADEAYGGLSEEDLDARTLMTLEMLNHQRDLHLRRNGGTANGESRVRGVSHASARRNGGNPNGSRLRVTVELKTPQSVTLAKTKGANVVYADDLICQYITLDAHAHDASPIYSRLIDTHDQSIELLEIELSALRGVTAAPAFDALARHIGDTGRMWLGLTIPLTYLIDALATVDDMDVVLKESGLLADTERLWEEVRDELPAALGKDGTASTPIPRCDLVDIPTLRPDHPLFSALREYEDERGAPALLLLNPWGRKTLCLHILDRVLAAADDAPRLQAICMHPSKLRSSGSETPILIPALPAG